MRFMWSATDKRIKLQNHSLPVVCLQNSNDFCGNDCPVTAQCFINTTQVTSIVIHVSP